MVMMTFMMTFQARALGEAQRRHKLEVQVMCKLHEERLNEDRRALEQHYADQMQVRQGRVLSF